MNRLFIALIFLLPLSVMYSQVTINVPGDYPTIQAAINSANNGDLVLVADGTYIENISFMGKAITVASHFIQNGDTSHIFNTVIDGSHPSNADSGSVVTFKNGEDTTSVLKGFTIKNGTGTIAISPKVGAGVFVFQSGALICNNIIENNSISYPTAFGGGICVALNDSYTTILRSNIIRNNSVRGPNQAWGGGICLYQSGTIYIENNIISSNTIEGDVYPFGGGMELYECGPTYIRSNEIIDNQVIGNNASGGAIDLFSAIGELVIHNNLIKGNYTDQPTQWGGGGLSLGNWNNSPLTITNNLIVENTAYQGGGVLLAFTAGSGQTNTVLMNNTIVYNTAEIGGGIHLQDSDSTTRIINSIIWGNTFNSGGQINGTVTVVYSDVEGGGFPGEGNIDADPSFDDTLLHLANSSLCIGAGIDSLDIGGTMYYCPPFCYYGSPRPNPAGTMPDIGACESPLQGPITMVSGNMSQIPNEYSLTQNYPNPFNPGTTIMYGIPERSFVELRIYDILGREVELIVNKEQDAGYFEINFNASQLSSGVYFYSIKAGDFIQVRKMMLLK